MVYWSTFEFASKEQYNGTSPLGHLDYSRDSTSIQGTQILALEKC